MEHVYSETGIFALFLATVIVIAAAIGAAVLARRLFRGGGIS